MQARFHSLLLGLMIITTLASAQIYDSDRTTTISGTVQWPTGWADGVRVEVYDAMGILVSTTFTDRRGAFGVLNLRPGTYEVVVLAGMQQVRERLFLRPGDNPIMVRLAGGRPAPAADSSQHSVSVAELQVPKQARKAARQASEALAERDFPKAEKCIEKALAEYPRYAKALALRGIVRLDQGKPEEAREALEQAVETDPNYPMAYFALGAAYNALSRFDDAQRVLDRGLRIQPGSWQGYFELGKANLGRGRPQDALRELNRAQRLAPDDFALLHVVKAHANLMLENYTEATAELKLYLRRDPDGPNAKYARDALEKVRSFRARQ